MIHNELMKEGIHLDLDTWIVPDQIRKANLCRGLGNRYTPAGTDYVMIHNTSVFLLPYRTVLRLLIYGWYYGIAILYYYCYYYYLICWHVLLATILPFLIV